MGVREIAQRADVTPGMISYYFGDKDGLLEATLEAVHDRLIVELREIASRPPSEAPLVETIVRTYVAILAREPWIPRFQVQETGASARLSVKGHRDPGPPPPSRLM